jgi:double-stranded uracil-DNA glycosylase
VRRHSSAKRPAHDRRPRLLRRGPGRLPDHLRPRLRVLFVGINPGLRSAAVGHHFAGFSNRFWRLLRDSRLVKEPLTCKDDGRLPEWGYGITNLVARPSRGIEALGPEEYVAGRRALLAKIKKHGPRVVALVGVTIYRELSNVPQAPVRLGLQRDTLGGAPVFVLPNPSGRNAHYSYAAMLRAFRSLREFLAREPRRAPIQAERPR